MKEIHDEDAIIQNCIFCKIITKEIPSVKVYEDDDVCAFLDIHPQKRGHVLVIPKMHFENIYGLPVMLWCQMNIAVQKIAIALKSALSADGIQLRMDNESAATQEIFHAHIHVIPMYNENTETKYTYIAGEMEEIAELLQKELK